MTIINQSRPHSMVPTSFLLFSLALLLLPLLISCQAQPGHPGPGQPGPAQPGPGQPGPGQPAPRQFLPPKQPTVPLQVGFYSKSCPKAEEIIREVFFNRFKKDPGQAPGLVRLIFHDCFVMGCDASILLDETPTKEETEKSSTHNGPNVKGYDVVDEVKTAVEAACPGVVSCADIIVFGARDALNYTGLPNYDVAAGRRDSLDSLSRNVPPNLPLPNTPLQEIVDMFYKKGMTLEDIVTLIGSHSIGTAHCISVADRFRDPVKSQDMDRGYVLRMLGLTVCQSPTQVVPFDPYTQNKMDSRYYSELVKRRALLESDGNLNKIPEAHELMVKYAANNDEWMKKFTDAMQRLGNVEVKTGTEGEIRKKCRFNNAGGGGGGGMDE